jgi:hypothetical protein
MKRCLVVVTLVIALAMPAMAVAGIHHFDGSVDPSGSISFDAKKRLGRVVEVEPGFAFTRVRVGCDDGHHHIMGSFDFAMDVHRRRFDGTGSYEGGGRVTVSGELSPLGRRARGTIQVSGDFSAINATGCYAKHDWRAKKT